MIRMLRTVGMTNFRTIWQESMDDSWFVRTMEQHCRIARMIWPDLDHKTSFRHYIWHGSFGDLDHVSSGLPYVPPDKPCDLLEKIGHMAIIRVMGRRYLLVNHENWLVLILKCHSRTMDAKQILADIAI